MPWNFNLFQLVSLCLQIGISWKKFSKFFSISNVLRTQLLAHHLTYYEWSFLQNESSTCSAAQLNFWLELRGNCWGKWVNLVKSGLQPRMFWRAWNSHQQISPSNYDLVNLVDSLLISTNCKVINKGFKSLCHVDV